MYAYSRCCSRAVVSKMFSEVKMNEAFPLKCSGKGNRKKSKKTT